MKLSTVILLINILLVISIGAVQAQRNDIEKKIDSLFSNYNNATPGVAIAVVKDGNMVFKKGYGSAQLEYSIPITTQTKFNIASVSKQFTAFAIYLLEREGKLSFDDDIRTYFPDLPDYGKTIRIKHLLAHTSGLKDQAALLALAGWYVDEDVATTEQILKLVNKQTRLNFETGNTFGYSNTGYTLLAEIVSRVSKLSFAQFTKEYIFHPLGMVNTQFSDDLHHLVINRAYAYEKIKGNYLKRDANYSNVGPSNLFTTVEDLIKWVNNFKQPVVGDTSLIRAFNAVSLFDNGRPVIWSAIPGDTTFHAKGQLHWQFKGLRAISHGGHTGGFRAVLTRFPDQDFSIITLSNDESYAMLGKVLPIVELYLKDQLHEVPTISNVQQPVKRNDQTFSGNVKYFEGVYVNDDLSTTYIFHVVNGKLIMTHYRFHDVALTPIGENKFSGVNSFPFELQFLMSGKTITGFKISNFGAKNVHFRKI